MDATVDTRSLFSELTTQLIQVPAPICLTGVERFIFSSTNIPIRACIYDERQNGQPQNRNRLLNLQVNDRIFIAIETPFNCDAHLKTYHATVIAILHFPHYPSAKFYGLQTRAGALSVLAVPSSSLSLTFCREEIQAEYSDGSVQVEEMSRYPAACMEVIAMAKARFTVATDGLKWVHRNRLLCVLHWSLKRYQTLRSLLYFKLSLYFGCA
ncbi:hypothetical protein H0H93_007264 [Arthromyces matolae]|nr:hypothetical protein H0H93_007264 [Arthromyces matolae]